jgi:cyclophilin family peptidyl-prolyl cis-trans isomerase/predicted DsbA family dithiol-disulfide isomerase
MMRLNQLALFIFITLFVQNIFVAIASSDNTKSKQANNEVIFETSMGSFTVELYPDKAPKTVTNFLTYIDEGFYDNTVFHRVIPNFVIQGGGFTKGMDKKYTHAPVVNESDNGLKNTRGTISMARTRDPHSATSQFFINEVHNITLDSAGAQPGYTVFGKIKEGMDVIDRITKVKTKTSGPYKDVPAEDVIILSAKRNGSLIISASKTQEYKEGEHYVVLDKPVATRDSSKVEVVEMFSYGCPHCFEFEPLVKNWSKQQDSDVDFWFFPAVWNKPMKLLAQAFYTAQELNVTEKIHLPLFSKVVLEQQSVRDEGDLADLFEKYGVNKKDFSQAFNSKTVTEQVVKAEQRVADYKPVGVPEIVVNGKYRIDRMRAGGQAEMLAVVDFLIKKERAALDK